MISDKQLEHIEHSSSNGSLSKVATDEIIKEIALLRDIAEKVIDSDIFWDHMGSGSPCRHEYRSCTCGKDALFDAVKNWRHS